MSCLGAVWQGPDPLATMQRVLRSPRSVRWNPPTPAVFSPIAACSALFHGSVSRTFLSSTICILGLSYPLARPSFQPRLLCALLFTAWFSVPDTISQEKDQEAQTKSSQPPSAFTASAGGFLGTMGPHSSQGLHFLNIACCATYDLSLIVYLTIQNQVRCFIA